jgi:hypothetical protein
VLDPDRPVGFVRELSPTISIRTGKFGEYIFYKKPRAKQPQFLKLNGFGGDYKKCDKSLLLNWIKQDWTSGCIPSDPAWNDIWGNNVRVAVLVDNEASRSELNVSYSAVGLNKAEEDCWIVFPWEDWWK